ncbi:MAG: ferrous iron transport protein B [Candidatus Symbiothrix sp.]|jgi:small GTP-binding protein|nr:ferrous iron transport protein B [Candidatus Symbiothrix sp.]
MHRHLSLAKLKNGDEAIIAHVLGEGAFRHRLTEMGFVRGKKVKVIKNAPFQDPVEYEIMGYKVSLRHSEAELIQVVPLAPHLEEKLQRLQQFRDFFLPEDENRQEEIAGEVADQCPQRNDDEGAREHGKTIHVALVGNPNSGKTTLFNHASGSHERVGNYGGVTVDVKEATMKKDGYTFKLFDLPGTYSITEYTPEELYVRQHLLEQKPDIVINVVDASNLERNLYLTTQLIDMDVKVVIALNMYDELTAKGATFDYQALGEMIGIPIIPTVASHGKGINELLEKIIDVYEDRDPTVRKIHINYGTEDTVEDAHYGFIAGALKETYQEPEVNPEDNKVRELDDVLTHRVLGFPIFLFFMWLMFQATFSLGQYPMDWIESGVGMLSDWVGTIMSEGALRDLLVDGIIAGVGSVIVFLPNILILFFFISLMEDTGYMARAAFMMDKLMHKIGLHGKSFIPLVMGFGCNVPAVMATRTLENRKDRILTMLITPFMSCSARLPVYLLIVSAFFTAHQGLVLFSVYLAGILMAILVAIVLSKTVFAKKEVPFVMELPPYRIPTLRNTTVHMWHKGQQYLTKMGTIILVASILIWGLSYFPQNEEPITTIATNEVTMSSQDVELLQQAKQEEHSYIGQLGHFIEPVLLPLGFDWKMGVSIIAGMGAKEIVVSTMGILYQADVNADEASDALIAELQQQNYTPVVAYGFMLFVLIYFPCIAVIAAIKKEAGWSWAIFTMVYTTCLAWVVAFLVNQLTPLFT